MLTKDIESNVVPMEFAEHAARTANGSYTQGLRKNMRRKELVTLFLIHVSAINTNLKLKWSTCEDHGGEYADITEGTMKAIPGSGEGGAIGAVASVDGEHTITEVGTYALQIPGGLYKQFLSHNHQTTGGAATFGILAVATGPNLPIAS